MSALTQMDWTRGRPIGRGSSATVSLATSRRSGDIFAVKSVELAGSELLQREQRILSSLCSPYVVGYRGADISSENNELLYNLFMEYVPGGTLTDAIRLRGGELEESEIGFYARQIAQGLVYLHSLGLAHCDIKGRNIFVGENGAKIGDLGCAKWIDPKSRYGGGVEAMPIAGTPAFMAPEVARGEEQGFAADVWALGCTIIEMATGSSPWPGANDPVSVLYRIGFSGESPEIPRRLSENGKDFLSKCLSRDPEKRWSAGELLKHPFLEEFSSQEKVFQELNSNSPTSILENDFWDCVEEGETPGERIQTSSLNSAEERIGRLTSFSSTPKWAGDENWVTIRSNVNESGSFCGSVKASSRDRVDDPVLYEDSSDGCSDCRFGDCISIVFSTHTHNCLRQCQAG
ncbi:mitogen-activated protein kinase kinase kinase 18-like [Malania oleifera]|uniref:mitogen-activated protein kinase kinase kinase 18-like n=1 Tax=Malania oleifera TaxID=397392 RepID=UPI0025AEA5F4|nr:mitogen-activated protein kinase kinase kinase 18-like [Malania oleifera]